MEHFIEEYVHLLKDPAHLALEFTFVLVDYLIIQTVVAKWRKHFHKDIAREHAVIEAEHGLKHPVAPVEPPQDVLDAEYPKFDVLPPRYLRPVPKPPQEAVYDAERDGL
jgi:hypothetical protein